MPFALSLLIGMDPRLRGDDKFMTMQSISDLAPIISRYDALLLDLWGVIHDGSHLYPDVKETLVALRNAHKKIIFISNAPRRVAKAAAVLEQLGVRREWYDDIITSGEIGYQWLSSNPEKWGKRYYYIGPSKDADILDGLDYRRSDDIKNSDFLLNVGFGTEEQCSDDWQMLFRAAHALNLPMLCLNPDMEVVKISGEVYPCAGVLAFDYEKIGGKVTYFGKPYPEVYEHCMKIFAGTPKQKILAIGDGIATDIAGATRFGVDSVLVTGGILKKNGGDIAALCKKYNAAPNYIIPAFQF